jgi:hypothetical protein
MGCDAMQSGRSLLTFWSCFFAFLFEPPERRQISSIIPACDVTQGGILRVQLNCPSKDALM